MLGIIGTGLQTNQVEVCDHDDILLCGLPSCLLRFIAIHFIV